MDNICNLASQCPIFNGILTGKESTSRAYRVQFCEAGEDNWNTCKRFMTKNRFGKCPPDLLPNSSLTIEAIGIKYNLN